MLLEKVVFLRGYCLVESMFTRQIRTNQERHSEQLPGNYNYLNPPLLCKFSIVITTLEPVDRVLFFNLDWYGKVMIGKEEERSIDFGMILKLSLCVTEFKRSTLRPTNMFWTTSPNYSDPQIAQLLRENS